MMITIAPKFNAALDELAATIAVSTSSSGKQRNREKDVGHPHDGPIDPAAVVAGNRPERGADHDFHQNGEQPDHQRDPRAEEQPREHVAPDFVGSQQVATALRGILEARRQRGALPVDVVDGIRVERRQLPGENRRRDHQQQHDQSGDRQFVPAEALPKRDLRDF